MDGTRSAAVLLATAGLTGCINAPAGDWCAPWGRPDPPTPACLNYQAVESYLAALKLEIRPHFELPPGHNADGLVEVRFVIAPDGSLADRCVSRSTDIALARNAIAALDAAAPFPPLSTYARCLAGAEITRHVFTVEKE
jgi:hypothetical protein